MDDTTSIELNSLKGPHNAANSGLKISIIPTNF